MSKGRILIGPGGDGPAPSPSNAEDAASEYFYNAAFMGGMAPRPPIERWRADQRERFEAELSRLEAQRSADAAGAAEMAARRSGAAS